MDIQLYKNKMSEFKGQRHSIEKLLDEEKEKNSIYKKDYIDAELASDIIYHVAKLTQEGLSYKIENLVTMALDFVMDDPFEFVLKWDISNNRTLCTPLFKKDGMEFNPMKDSEGTALDVTSLALRSAVWSLPERPSSPLFVLDENFKHVSKGMRGRASLFMKEICDRLNVQIITATHIEDTIDGSDKIFKIVKENNVSRIKEEINV